MNYQGGSSGNRQHYNSSNSYRGSSYRGKSHRGGRGGYSSTRYNNTQAYEENAGRFPSPTSQYRGNYRGEHYTPQRGGYQSGSRGSYSESFPRYGDKRHSSAGYDSRPSLSQAERPQEFSAAPSPPIESPQTPLSRIYSTDSPFYHLTGLDEFTDDELERSRIRALFREDGDIDTKLQEQKLQLCKIELELGLLSTQSEKDALNVRLTQDNLDALLLMQ
ncbi:LANO_0E09560g1_1 [Lachancea nothofagi CBS 11611]|uniref:LANO_0E09560g1_1 n=1 Tax=Lachancea nothofagi CBS 11611 TaxID=1266666 RepID=A0A1G4JW21_9SACH|nr:LANO_0E09560g1_1 [Lachancea nothofagi CBS 11611]